MAKVIVKFLKAHGRYVKNDVAGFPPEVVKKWPEGICVPYDPDAEKAAATDTDAVGDLAAREQSLAGREAELEQRETNLRDELDERTKSLAQREAVLQEREKELDAARDTQVKQAAEATDKAATEQTTSEKKKAGKAAAGEPPAQGAKQ